ncbi:MAG: dienelactone hydrolase family protein [Lentisphaeraceae bacterium]|nr:dienelactone hydrolase family protein [Lentisphaeraceae bacterium]
MTIFEEAVLVETPTKAMRTVIFRPQAEGKFPAIILYSEIFQLTGPILRSAQMMAGHGFVVACPEVYYQDLEAGTVLGYDDEGKTIGNDLKWETPIEAFDEGAQSLIKFLQKQDYCTGELGTIGFCLGGHLAFRAALEPEIKACASFYGTDIHTGTLGKGKNCDTFERIGELNAEMLMVWGRQDPHVPQKGRAKIYQQMSAKNVRFSWHEFNAVHAFMRDEGERYNPQLAHQGYALANELFSRVLKG